MDSYSKEMIKQFYKIDLKVRKLSNHWTEANIIGPMVGIDVQ